MTIHEKLEQIDRKLDALIKLFGMGDTPLELFDRANDIEITSDRPGRHQATLAVDGAVYVGEGRTVNEAKRKLWGYVSSVLRKKEKKA